MTSLTFTHCSVALQEFKPAFAFQPLITNLFPRARIGPVPVGNGAAVHDKAKNAGMPVAVKAFKGFPVFCMPRGSARNISIPCHFQQDQITVAGNGVLIRALHKYLPVHLSAKFSSGLSPLIVWNTHVFDLPARFELGLRRLFKGFVGALVFGKLGRNIGWALQVAPGPLGVSQIKEAGVFYPIKNIGGALTFKNNGALQMIGIGRCLSRTYKSDKGEGHE
ncbi:hypothetical protein PsAD2_01466 [Pseudovibrio axinellae]|uniref:Uncharacterized protein n=1 Tax=Pseudovibrio axinellae TaxID=989403 RepID=A0A165ZZ58_9HYPH|nr:hypothetical protein PsAD2_01466 [Pseudovibrio axinellae]SER77532.1 hypothetical protein SAMN05421798_12214 [Pseudovibrio axinellae]